MRKMLAGPLVDRSTNDNDETYTRRFYLRATREQANAMLRRPRRAVKLLQEMEVLPLFGCHCSHCARDWDCCGRLFVYKIDVRRARRHVIFTAVYLRNV